MKKSIKYLLIIVLLLALIVVGVLLFRAYGNYQILKKDSEVLKYFISYPFDEKNHSDTDNSMQAQMQAQTDITNFLKEYCTEECIKKFIINRLVLPLYQTVFNEYSLANYKDISIDVTLEVSGSAKDKFYREYEMSYTYVDKNNKEYSLVDHFIIARDGGKISSISLKETESDIVELYKNR